MDNIMENIEPQFQKEIKLPPEIIACLEANRSANEISEEQEKELIKNSPFYCFPRTLPVKAPLDCDLITMCGLADDLIKFRENKIGEHLSDFLSDIPDKEELFITPIPECSKLRNVLIRRPKSKLRNKFPHFPLHCFNICTEENPKETNETKDATKMEKQ